MTKTVILKFRPMVLIAFIVVMTTLALGMFSILFDERMFAGWILGLITMWSGIWLIFNGEKYD